MDYITIYAARLCILNDNCLQVNTFFETPCIYLQDKNDILISVIEVAVCKNCVIKLVARLM